MSKSVYVMITERIIEQLESSVIPLEKPWTGVRNGAFNRISKKSYSLLNQMHDLIQLTKLFYIFNLINRKSKILF